VLEPCVCVCVCVCMNNVTVIWIKKCVLTERVKSVDGSFVQVKVDVFGHSERLALPVLSPRKSTKKRLINMVEKQQRKHTDTPAVIDFKKEN